jgi:hypothetical protein
MVDETTLIAMLERKEVEPIINVLTTQKSNGDDAKRCPLCTALK